MLTRAISPAAILIVSLASAAWAQDPGTASSQQALDTLWTPAVRAKIRNTATLNPAIEVRTNYLEVFYDSETGDANWGDSGEPYQLHTGDTIRIHGYLAAPVTGGPYPAIVIGHGHGGHGDPDFATALAALGYVALSIDGPSAGLSTGGPEDTEQAWITVEPSPNFGYLYHYAYAGMRALTLFEALAQSPGNPLHIDPQRLGVLGASMGGQFTYYINGVDDRVKAAVAISVAGDWFDTLFYPGSWLYHGLYYYTRDGLRSGVDAPNAVSNVCTDATLQTFLRNFDVSSYAPRQHGKLLTLIGTDDQYFPLPSINTAFDNVQSADHDPAFTSRVMIVPNGKHGVIDANPIAAVLASLGTVNAWLRHAFYGEAAPPETPMVFRWTAGEWMIFAVPARPGATPIWRMDLNYATQIDTTPTPACDFTTIPMFPVGNAYLGAVRIGAPQACGPPPAPDNVIYYASVKDLAGFTISSRVYRGNREMTFSPDFAPVLQHFPRDNFPVPPPPDRCLVPPPG